MLSHIANVIRIPGADGLPDLYVSVPEGRDAANLVVEVDDILSNLKAEMRKGKTGNLDEALAAAGFQYARVQSTHNKF